MKVIIKILLIAILSVTALNCTAQKKGTFQPKKVYESGNLIVTQISENAFEHTSFLQTQDFGNVPCNGLIVRDHNEVIIFDAPTNDTGSGELIKWISTSLNCKINVIIPTHFHNDCLGGLKTFHDNNIPSAANFKTIAFAKENNFMIPGNGFRDSLILRVGQKRAVAKFFGEGHTRDNIIGYFPSENILFGGCLIKELGAGKGYLGDANVAAWSATVVKIKKQYPNVQLIVPGHGERGGKELLDYTIKLFKVK